MYKSLKFLDNSFKSTTNQKKYHIPFPKRMAWNRIINQRRYVLQANSLKILEVATFPGKKWQQRRKILTPAFHFSILRRFVEIFNDHSDKLITQLRQESRNYKTNVVPLITQCALNTICGKSKRPI